MKLLIPTRNRPHSLGTVLEYLETFYPETSVIVADGSREELKGEVAAAVGRFTRLKPEFRSYPFEMSFFDRVLHVLESLDDDFILMNADDDYPMVDVLQRAEGFLKENPDHVLAVGTLLVLELDADGRTAAHIRQVRPIANPRPEDRARSYAAWTFPLSYSLCRREVLIRRYRRSSDSVLGELDDLIAGLSDCLEGKVHAIGDVSLVLTRNASESYFRAKSKLEFFERGPDIARLARAFAAQLQQAGGMAEADALRLATEIFARRVGSYLTGIPYHHQAAFISSNIHRHPFLRHQCDAFDRMFEAGTEEQRRNGEKMRFISRALRGTAGLSGQARIAAPRPQRSPAQALPAAQDDSIISRINLRIDLDPDTMLAMGTGSPS